MGQPRIIKENKNQRIIFEIDCGSKDKPQVVWSKDGKQIKNEGRYLIDIDDSQANIFVIILEIDNVVNGDAGKYKCVAKNAKGESSVVIEFNLDASPEEKKKPEEKKPEEKKPEEKKPEEKKAEAAKSNDVAASFKEKPKDQVGLDGDKITVTCKVAGNPKPEITWFKNKQAIRKSKDFVTEFNGEIAKLTINDAYTEDTGDYSCEVWNEAGSQSSAFKITIKEKKGKMKRSRPKQTKEEPKTEEEIRKEKRKSDAKKQADQPTAEAAAAAAQPAAQSSIGAYFNFNYFIF